MLGRYAGLAVLLCSTPLLAQQTPAPSSFLEFPVIMRQNVTAGKSPVGTKIQAQLVIATLFDGVVLPRDAVFSGEVVESAAKSATAPSRLSLRLDTVQWKGGSKPVKLFLTSWYYPPRSELSDQEQDRSGIHGSIGVTMGGGRPYPPPIYPEGHGGISPDDNPGIPQDTGPATPASDVSQHRVQMRDVESERGADGAIALTSKRRDLKLDKITTYVLATGDLLPQQKHPSGPNQDR